MSSSSIDHHLTVTTNETGVSLGYGIGISVGILVLISTIMLASYVCVRIKSGNSATNAGGSSDVRGGSSGSNFLHHQQNSGGLSSMPILLMGLDWPTIDSYPKLLLGESTRLPEPNESPCSICLVDYNPKDSLRCMPNCNHCFHIQCIDQWLRMNATCPLCRNSPAVSMVNTPVTTPLSEFVPLTLQPR